MLATQFSSSAWVRFAAASGRVAAVSASLMLSFAPVHGQDVYPGGATAPLSAADPAAGEAEIEPEPLPASDGSYAATAAVDETTASAEINPSGEVSAVPKRFHYALRVNVRGVYDDNIFLDETNRVDDFYFAIEPGLTAGFGDVFGREENYFRLDYAPSLFIFADHSDANALQHLVRLEGQYRLSRLTLGLSQDIHLLEGANLAAAAGSTTNPTPGINLDAGGDTDVNIYNTRANLAYGLTGKTFLSGGLHYFAHDYEEDLISSEAISGNLFINFNYSPKLVVGVGGTAGYNWVDGFSPDQTFQQINGRVTYQATGKISLNASAGVEFRQFEDDLRGNDYVSPVYDIGAEYQPFDGTTLTLRGSRRTMNSAVFVGQDYASTNITFGARQRLLRRIYLGLAAGYENSDYFQTIEFVDAFRDDDYYFVQPAVDVSITRFWTAGAYYLHRRNDSSAEGFSFRDNQVGVRTSLTF